MAHPNHLEQFIPPDCREWIIIDEIQKIPALLDEVHRLIENMSYKFILSQTIQRLILFWCMVELKNIISIKYK